MKSRSASSTGRSADRVKLSCGRSDDQIRLPRKFGVLIEELRFASDSALEERGFETSVSPRAEADLSLERCAAPGPRMVF
jgi:hypothetical protein